MIDVITSLFRPLRIRIPYVIDVIFISDPDHIKRIEASGDVDRLHRYDTAALPWWVRFYFQATRFHDEKRDLWFLALEGAADPSYGKRHAYLREKVATGYTNADVETIARLLKTNAAEDVLAHELEQVVNRRFLGEEIPLSVTKEAKQTLQTFGEALLPWNYLRARRSQRDVTNYCARTLPRDVHALDIAHNIGTVVKTLTRALRILQANLEKPAAEIFTSHPLTLQAPRIAVRSSKLDGLLLFPTRAAWTVLIFKIGTAAVRTKDLFFTFGTGRSARACVFMDFFLALVGDVQQALRETDPARSRASLPER